MDVVFTYGRFNPPHLGHKMMIEKIINKAEKLKKTPLIIVSHTTGNPRNPLSVNKNLPLGKIAENFSKNSVMIVGENRKNAFSYLPFNRVALNRPNAAPSATKARAAAVNGNKELFKNLAGYNLTNAIRNRIVESSKPKSSPKNKKSK